MAAQEPAEVTGAATAPAHPILRRLREQAPWLLQPELGTCVVGTAALTIACAARGVSGPEPADLDLAWALDVEPARRLLEQHGVFVPTTDGNQERGTVAARIGGQRVEITTFRNSDAAAPMATRIDTDLRARDMTVGAIACELGSGRIHDPLGGLQHWQQRRIVAVGDPADRIREHPVRWLRYYRKAHEWGFRADRAIRAVGLPTALFDTLPREAVALEVRAMLRKLRSPGRCLHELHEVGLLAHLAPELDRQFDGRPAGPQHWHPEISQALHLILSLEWAVDRGRHLDERDRTAVLLAVLCHDLGKGYTPAADLPGHNGHEQAGLPYVNRLLDRWPSLCDQQARTLALHVCELHVEIRHLEQLRPGTLAKLYDRCFRPRDYPVDLFALAVGADSGGRLGLAETGDRVCARVASDLRWLRACCGRVDAAALRQQHGDDLPAFRAALHEARARAIRRALRQHLATRP